MPFWNGLPHSCTIYGPPLATRDTYGGTTVTWPTVRASGVPCLINSTGGSPAPQFQQEGMGISHTVGFKADVVIERGDKIVDESGNSYHVEWIQRGRAFSFIPVLVTVGCRQILG